MSSRPKLKTTVTLLCDRLSERVLEWRHQRSLGTSKPKGVYAAFRDRPNGARFIDMFPQYAGKEISFTYGDAFSLPAAVADWLFRNGYLQPKQSTPLWK